MMRFLKQKQKLQCKVCYGACYIFLPAYHSSFWRLCWDNSIRWYKYSKKEVKSNSEFSFGDFFKDETDRGTVTPEGVGKTQISSKLGDRVGDDTSDVYTLDSYPSSADNTSMSEGYISSSSTDLPNSLLAPVAGNNLKSSMSPVASFVDQSAVRLPDALMPFPDTDAETVIKKFLLDKPATEIPLSIEVGYNTLTATSSAKLIDKFDDNANISFAPSINPSPPVLARTVCNVSLVTSTKIGGFTLPTAGSFISCNSVGGDTGCAETTAKCSIQTPIIHLSDSPQFTANRHRLPEEAASSKSIKYSRSSAVNTFKLPANVKSPNSSTGNIRTVQEVSVIGKLSSFKLPVNSASPDSTRTQWQNNDPQSFECATCGILFDTRAKITKHVFTHTPEVPSPYVCNVCGASFDRPNHLVRHSYTHGRVRPFACEHCEKTFVLQSALRVHLRSHTGERLYTCGFCDKAFSVPYLRTKHECTHIGEGPFKCQQCDRAFGQKATLRAHLFKHIGDHPYSCDECGKNFTQPSALKFHRRTHSGNRPFSCQLCGVAFRYDSSLKAHSKTHARDAQRPRHTCPECDEVFAFPALLKHHMREHVGERRHGCDLCNKSFSLRSQLEEHSRIHTGCGPYLCDRCGASFVSEGILSRHRLTHMDVTEKRALSPLIEKPLFSPPVKFVENRDISRVPVNDVDTALSDNKPPSVGVTTPSSKLTALAIPTCMSNQTIIFIPQSVYMQKSNTMNVCTGISLPKNISVASKKPLSNQVITNKNLTPCEVSTTDDVCIPDTIPNPINAPLPTGISPSTTQIMSSDIPEISVSDDIPISDSITPPCNLQVPENVNKSEALCHFPSPQPARVPESISESDVCPIERVHRETVPSDQQIRHLVNWYLIEPFVE